MNPPSSSSYVLCLLFIGAFLIFSQGAPTVRDGLDNDYKIRDFHESWMKKHGRVYKNWEEKEKRFKAFKANVEKVNAFNKDGVGNVTLVVNQFADYTQDDFEGCSLIDDHLQFITESVQKKDDYDYDYDDDDEEEDDDDEDIPAYLDWRESGAVTAVVEQGYGCCWAIATVGAIEGIHQIKTGKLIPLSAQQLVDCEKQSKGYKSGFVRHALEYVVSNGLASAEDYPLTGEEGECMSGFKRAANITGYGQIFNEDDLLKRVAKQPVTLLVDARFVNYKPGTVYMGPCLTTGKPFNHEMLIVGYGTTVEDGVQMDYWLLKNSWGDNWGEGGYMRILRGFQLCGLPIRAFYPIID